MTREIQELERMEDAQLLTEGDLVRIEGKDPMHYLDGDSSDVRFIAWKKRVGGHISHLEISLDDSRIRNGGVVPGDSATTRIYYGNANVEGDKFWYLVFSYKLNKWEQESK